MWLVKLGGSLMSSNGLHACLETLYQHGSGKVLIIPGGGIFADRVRLLQKEWGFDDEAAHHMALSSMEQYAFYCQAVLPQLELTGSLGSANELLEKNKLVCFLPHRYLFSIKSIPMNWSFTSDSISALLAAEFKAEGLILLKSVQQLTEEVSMKKLAESGVVDALFPDFCRQLSCPIHCLAAKEGNRLAELLL